MLKMLAGQFPPRRCRDEATIQSTANFGNPILGGSPIFSIFFPPTKDSCRWISISQNLCDVASGTLKLRFFRWSYSRFRIAEVHGVMIAEI